MNIIRMSGGLGNQMFHYALYLKLRSMGKEVKFDDINEYRGERVRPIMLAIFGIDYPRAAWDEITVFTDQSMELKKRIRRQIFGRRAICYEEQGCFDPKVLSFDSMYLKGAFQSEKYFEDIKEEVRSTYQFPELEEMHLPQKLYLTTKTCLDRIEGCQAVALHMYRETPGIMRSCMTGSVQKNITMGQCVTCRTNIRMPCFSFSAMSQNG